VWHFSFFGFKKDKTAGKGAAHCHLHSLGFRLHASAIADQLDEFRRSSGCQEWTLLFAKKRFAGSAPRLAILVAADLDAVPTT
jgi:hypothetical protein